MSCPQPGSRSRHSGLGGRGPAAGAVWVLLLLLLTAFHHSRAVEHQAKQTDVVVGDRGAAGLDMQPNVEELCLCDEHVPGQQRADAQDDQDAIHQAKPAGQHGSQRGGSLSTRGRTRLAGRRWWEGRAQGTRAHLSLMGGCFICPPPVPARALTAAAVPRRGVAEESAAACTAGVGVHNSTRSLPLQGSPVAEETMQMLSVARVGLANARDGLVGRKIILILVEQLESSRLFCLVPALQCEWELFLKLQHFLFRPLPPALKTRASHGSSAGQWCAAGVGAANYLFLILCYRQRGSIWGLARSHSQHVTAQH